MGNKIATTAVVPRGAAAAASSVSSFRALLGRAMAAGPIQPNCKKRLQRISTEIYVTSTILYVHIPY